MMNPAPGFCANVGLLGLTAGPGSSGMGSGSKSHEFAANISRGMYGLLVGTLCFWCRPPPSRVNSLGLGVMDATRPHKFMGPGGLLAGALRFWCRPQANKKINDKYEAPQVSPEPIYKFF